MAQDIDSLIRVTLGASKLEATLRIVKGTEVELVDEMSVSGIATARGVQKTPELTEAIAKAVADYDPEAEDDFTCVIARGTPPKHGESGRFEIAEELAEIQQRAAKLKRRRIDDEAGEQTDDDNEGTSSHYDRSTLTIVKPGDRIGCIIKQTEGEDGIDVCGGTLAAQDGKPASITIDEATVEKKPDGNLIARVGGLLTTNDDRVRISEDLEVAGYVDFSTGNVDFCGNILVRKGVRDCFVVDAGGSIKIDELAEAADLIAGKDIELNRGMAGREKGSLRAGRDLRSKFIDSTEITVARDLHIERELSHCNVTVWRDIVARNATLIGGECVVAGTAEFAQVGTESGTATIIKLGQLTSLELLIREATDLLPRIEQRASDAKRELEQLQNNTTKLTATQAESITELQFVAMDAEGRAAPLRQSIGVAVEVIESLTKHSLIVHKKVMPGTKIWIGNRIATVTEEIRGPVRIEADGHTDPVVISMPSESQTPLGRYANMNIDDTVLDLDDVKKTYGLAA